MKKNIAASVMGAILALAVFVTLRGPIAQAVPNFLQWWYGDRGIKGDLVVTGTIYGDVDGDVIAANTLTVDSRDITYRNARKGPIAYWDDFIINSHETMEADGYFGFGAWKATGLGSGTTVGWISNLSAAPADQPGLTRIRLPGDTVSSAGACLKTYSNAFTISGGEYIESIFKIQNAPGAGKLRVVYGFYNAGDPRTTLPPADGLYFVSDSDSVNVKGQARKSSGTTYSTSAYTYTPNTFYRFSIETASTNDLATFEIHTLAGNTLLWSDTLGTTRGYPDDVAQGNVLYAWYDAADYTSTTIMYLDWIYLEIDRDLAR